MRLSRILLWGLLIVAAATVLLVAGSFIHPWFMPAQEEIIQIGVVAVLYVALALGCAVVMERGRARALMGSGIAFGAIALGIFTVAIFLTGPVPSWVWEKAIVWPAVWACLVLVIGILLLPGDRGRWWKFLRRLAIVLTSFLAAHYCLAVTCSGLDILWCGWWSWNNTLLWPTWLAVGALTVVAALPSTKAGRIAALRWLGIFVGCLAIGHISLVSVLYWSWNDLIPDRWHGVYDFEEWAFRTGAVVGLLAGAAVAATFLTLWMPGLTGRGEVKGPVVQFALQCPRCGHEQTGRTGGCLCHHCGLSIRVEVV